MVLVTHWANVSLKYVGGGSSQNQHFVSPLGRFPSLPVQVMHITGEEMKISLTRTCQCLLHLLQRDCSVWPLG